MRPLLERKSNLNLRNKRTVYNTIVAATMLYGVAAWEQPSKRNRNRIQVVQNKTLGTIANAPWHVRNTTLHRDVDVKTIKEIIKERTTRTYERAEIHDNQLLRDAADYLPIARTRYKRGRHMIGDLQPD